MVTGRYSCSVIPSRNGIWDDKCGTSRLGTCTGRFWTGFPSRFHPVVHDVRIGAAKRSNCVNCRSIRNEGSSLENDERLLLLVLITSSKRTATNIAQQKLGYRTMITRSFCTLRIRVVANCIEIDSHLALI
jgi:hypothetical protein